MSEVTRQEFDAQAAKIDETSANVNKIIGVVDRMAEQQERNEAQLGKLFGATSEIRADISQLRVPRGVSPNMIVTTLVSGLGVAVAFGALLVSLAGMAWLIHTLSLDPVKVNARDASAEREKIQDRDYESAFIRGRHEERFAAIEDKIGHAEEESQRDVQSMAQLVLERVDGNDRLDSELRDADRLVEREQSRRIQEIYDRVSAHQADGHPHTNEGHIDALSSAFREHTRAQERAEDSMARQSDDRHTATNERQSNLIKTLIDIFQKKE